MTDDIQKRADDRAILQAIVDAKQRYIVALQARIDKLEAGQAMENSANQSDASLLAGGIIRIREKANPDTYKDFDADRHEIVLLSPPPVKP